MRAGRNNWNGALVSCLTTALALGCLGRSAEVRYFAMSPVQAPAHDGVPGDLAVAVTAVSFPRYLERPQMVTRGEGPELQFDEIKHHNDRRSYSLAEDILQDRLTWLEDPLSEAI